MNNYTPNSQNAKNAVAIGYQASSTKDGAISIGGGTGGNDIVKANGIESIAIGNKATANANWVTAIGVGTIASKEAATALGVNAKASGQDSTAIGSAATANNNRSTAIGFNAATNADNQIMLGDSGTTVVVPGTLQVLGSLDLSQITGRITLGNSSAKVLVPGNMAVGGFLGSKHMYVNSHFVVSGQNNHWGRDDSDKYRNFRIKDSGGYTVSEMKGWSTYKNWHDEYSDRRLKNVGKEFVGGLEEVKKLEPFNYTFKKDPTKTPRVGVMAQDLEKIFPKAIFKGDDGFLRIRMEDMFYAVVNAVKELDRKITELKTQEISNLKSKLEENTKTINDLQKQNEEQQKAIKALEERLKKLEKSKNKE